MVCGTKGNRSALVSKNLRTWKGYRIIRSAKSWSRKNPSQMASGGLLLWLECTHMACIPIAAVSLPENRVKPGHYCPRFWAVERHSMILSSSTMQKKGKYRYVVFLVEKSKNLSKCRPFRKRPWSLGDQSCGSTGPCRTCCNSW